MTDVKATLGPGFGLGLRPPHYDALLNEHRGSVSWLEVLTENYLIPGGRPLHYLDRLRPHYPFALHGVSLSIGSSDPLDTSYLQGIRTLARRFETLWISDHLCWTGVDGTNLHDLMPLPYHRRGSASCCRSVSAACRNSGRAHPAGERFELCQFCALEMSEWEFLSEVAARADCLLLLDMNNVYVSSVNHEFDPQAFLRGIPVERVRQFHLAGHSSHAGCGVEYLIDTHDAPVAEPVWKCTRPHWQALAVSLP